MDSNKVVKIIIPEELKKSFSRERQLEHIRFGARYKRNIQDGIEKNDVYKVHCEIATIKHLLRKVGFYKNYPQWFNFALMSLMNERGIPVRNKWEKADVYSSLASVNEELKYWSRFDFEDLVKRATYFTHKVKDGEHYNRNIEEMCRLFLEIGFGQLDPYQLADLCYETFLRSLQVNKQDDYIKPNVRIRK